MSPYCSLAKRALTCCNPRRDRLITSPLNRNTNRLRLPTRLQGATYTPDGDFSPTPKSSTRVFEIQAQQFSFTPSIRPPRENSHRAHWHCPSLSLRMASAARCFLCAFVFRYPRALRGNPLSRFEGTIVGGRMNRVMQGSTFLTIINRYPTLITVKLAA